MTDLILDLDARRSRDPAVAGAKAAWLARARAAGLPVLPGLVIPAEHSVATMELGVSLLAERGPGGARLAMAQHPLAIGVSEALAHGIEDLGVPAIVRSSSLLEDNGEWAGAFESFVALRRDDVEPAVRSCWASAFTASTLMRAEAAGIGPGSVPMAILVQPFIEPEAGGTARIADGKFVIDAVDSSPTPLLGGIETGTGIEPEAEASVVETLEQAHSELGANSCEWAIVDGELFVLQLKRVVDRSPGKPVLLPPVDHPMAERVAQIRRRVPGVLGERLLLRWALGADVELLDDVSGAEPAEIDPLEALDRAEELARSLTAEVWDMARPIAWDTATNMLQDLTSSDATAALEQVSTLKRPDEGRARQAMSLVARVRQALAALRQMRYPSLAWHIDAPGAVRVLSGAKPEPVYQPDPLIAFDLAVVKSLGNEVGGIAASPGHRSGRGCFIADPADVSPFRPKDVVVAAEPSRDLAPLLWNAAGLVTAGGSPAAHLFEVARALAIPAVCGVDLDALDHGSSMDRQLRVDGSSGVVGAMPW